MSISDSAAKSESLKAGALSVLDNGTSKVRSGAGGKASMSLAMADALDVESQSHKKSKQGSGKKKKFDSRIQSYAGHSAATDINESGVKKISAASSRRISSVGAAHEAGLSGVADRTVSHREKIVWMRANSALHCATPLCSALRRSIQRHTVLFCTTTICPMLRCCAL